MTSCVLSLLRFECILLSAGGQRCFCWRSSVLLATIVCVFPTGFVRGTWRRVSLVQHRVSKCNRLISVRAVIIITRKFYIRNESVRMRWKSHIGKRLSLTAGVLRSRRSKNFDDYTHTFELSNYFIIFIRI